MHAHLFRSSSLCLVQRRDGNSASSSWPTTPPARQCQMTTTRQTLLLSSTTAAPPPWSVLSFGLFSWGAALLVCSCVIIPLSCTVDSRRHSRRRQGRAHRVRVRGHIADGLRRRLDEVHQHPVPQMAAPSLLWLHCRWSGTLQTRVGATPAPRGLCAFTPALPRLVTQRRAEVPKQYRCHYCRAIAYDLDPDDMTLVRAAADTGVTGAPFRGPFLSAGCAPLTHVMLLFSSFPPFLG